MWWWYDVVVVVGGYLSASNQEMSIALHVIRLSEIHSLIEPDLGRVEDCSSYLVANPRFPGVQEHRWKVA